MFVVSFANFKSRTLSRHPSGDRLMPRAKVRAIAQASHGNITVLSHLNTVGRSTKTANTVIVILCSSVSTNQFMFGKIFFAPLSFNFTFLS